MSIGRVPGVTGIQPSIVDAKGDLIVATAADSVDRLAVGSANQVLTVDSSTATGLKWATPAAGGKVLQVISATTSTQAANSTTTYADTGLSASITPSATSSKILVIVAQNGCFKGNGNNGNRIWLQLLRGGSQIMEVGDHLWTDSAIYNVGSVSMVHLDSPSTTSSTTYKTQLRNGVAAAEVRTQSGNVATSSITLLEIGA